MIRNYFKTAFRNLKRNKSYALINVLGLSVGIAACLLIFLVIQYETSFDKFHPKRNQIYRVGTKFYSQDGFDFSGGIAFPAGAAMKADFPQIKEKAQIFRMGDNQVSINEGNQIKKFSEPGIYFSEPDFFKIFNFPWVSGDPQKALATPNTVALTERIATKYFGDWNKAIGKTIKVNNKEVYTVGGIIKDIPGNSDFPIDIVLSYISMKNYGYGRNLEDWISTFGDAYCFVVVDPSYSITDFNKALKDFKLRHVKDQDDTKEFVAQPLNTIHYDDRFGNFRARTFGFWLIRVLMLIGVFLVVIACVNFINLATAQAVNRSKEVGVRKVLGGNKRQLAFQFLSETGLIILISLALALGIAFAALPFLNDLLRVEMSLNIFHNIQLIVFLIATAVIVTLLSGLYPALILSGFNPILALKSKIAAKSIGGISLRRALVVLQFGIAHVLIIGTLIVVSQMNLFRNATMGFTKSSILNVSLPGDSISHTKFDYLKNRLLQNPDIASVSFSIAPPATRGNWNTDFKYDHGPQNTDFSATLKWADADYFKTYSLEFIAGRPYTLGDTVREVVVNQTLLNKLGVKDPQQALGKQIDFWDGDKLATISGVIKDFNSQSLREPISPVILGTWKDTYNTLNIKGKGGRDAAIKDYTEKLWNEVYPEYVYNYQYLDQTIENFYVQENQLAKLYKIFAGIAILISCLGLYGLVSFMAAQRTKEVGIRKVLGASASHIVYLLSKEFSILIIVAFVIAAPLAYYLMHGWLQDYTYRIKPGVLTFFFAIAGSMLIAWMTVGYRAIKAALANPVKSLRTE